MTALTIKRILLLGLLSSLAGCSIYRGAEEATVGEGMQPAKLTPRTSTYTDLTSLPEPRGLIVATVYNFRDQTGQYKPQPSSSFSTAVTQGATSMLTNAMNESGWFIPLEREGLQNLLTERKIIRAALKKPDTPGNNDQELPSLLAANILLEGGIVAYETNIRTGGAGARYFGIGMAEQYRQDQVTVNLRAIDIRSGRILESVMTTKTIFSREITTGVYRFVEFKRLLELETGATSNEPSQLCVMSAIEAALIHLIAKGVAHNAWSLKNPEDADNPVLQAYLHETVELF